jgi:hypothetical protein
MKSIRLIGTPMAGFSSKMLSASAHKRRYVPQRGPFPVASRFTAIAKYNMQ